MSLNGCVLFSIESINLAQTSFTITSNYKNKQHTMRNLRQKSLFNPSIILCMEYRSGAWHDVSKNKSKRRRQVDSELFCTQFNIKKSRRRKERIICELKKIIAINFPFHRLYLSFFLLLLLTNYYYVRITCKKWTQEHEKRKLCKTTCTQLLCIDYRINNADWNPFSSCFHSVVSISAIVHTLNIYV